MSESTDNYRVKLVELAHALAHRAYSAEGTRGHEVEYLARFRAAYIHLASTIETSPIDRLDERTEEAAFGSQRS